MTYKVDWALKTNYSLTLLLNIALLVVSSTFRCRRHGPGGLSLGMCGCHAGCVVVTWAVWLSRGLCGCHVGDV